MIYLKLFKKMHKSVFSGLCFFFFSLLLVVNSSLLSACDSDDVIPEISKNDSIEHIDSIDITDTIIYIDTVPGVTVLLESDIVDYHKFYKPNEHKSLNMLRSDSKWSFVRSKQSEHFIVFWESGFGNNPNATTVPAEYRVNIDELLNKAEEFYNLNINQLKFAEVGVGKSNLDKYKMQIYLFYTQEWMAFGAGYDDVIGALWINPGTVHPVGSVIAHEIGHSFQYQVFCDLGNGAGFRYGFGGNGGNGFWEQTAQWQAYQSYPEQLFEGYHFPIYCDNYHRHICNENYRYASYFIHYYWIDKHGIDMVGKVWREAKEPEDPMEAYMRINELTVEDFNAELFEAAARNVTWDYDAIRSYGSNYVVKQSYKFYQLADSSYQVAYSRCPGTTGYNVIPLNVPKAGTVVTTKFLGLEPGSALANNDPGTYSDDGKTLTKRSYNNSSLMRAGWRYGYVALLENGQRVYGEMNKKPSMNAEFTIPFGCAKLWFVVLGAPSTYAPHPWDEKESNDDQWPYKVKFENTDLYGNIAFDGTETPEDVSFSFNVAFPFSADAYPGATVSLDINKLTKAFVLQPSSITSLMDSKIKFYAIESNNKLNANITANGYGHWFDATGDVVSWGINAMIFSEFDAAGFSFSIGQYPGHCSPGDQYKIKQALVYTYEAGKSVQATFELNITIE